jgi:hypothetical protein
MANLDAYINAIVTIKDKSDGRDLSAQPRDLCLMTHMYSNTKIPTTRFKLNNNVIKRNNSLIVGYKCLSCNVLQEITLNLYLRKVNKGVKACDACKNLDEYKRSQQVAYMTGNRIIGESLPKWSEKTLSERVAESLHDYYNEDSDFKTAYELIHLTSEEFNTVKNKIISVGNGKIKDLSGWEYLPVYKVGNQTKYTPMLIHNISNAIEKPHYIEWKCEICDSQFINRDMEIQKNRIKILCAECGFSNRTFKVKSMNSPWGKIRYQSQQEFRFIQWCIDNNICIENGPYIEYVWKESTRKYRVDFQLPFYKLLVEIKDNHVWHKQQIDSGKWGAKEQIAKKWCEENKWNYDIVFPKTLASWKEKILKLKETCKI